MFQDRIMGIIFSRYVIQIAACGAGMYAAYVGWTYLASAMDSVRAAFAVMP